MTQTTYQTPAAPSTVLAVGGVFTSANSVRIQCSLNGNTLTCTSKGNIGLTPSLPDGVLPAGVTGAFSSSLPNGDYARPSHRQPDCARDGLRPNAEDLHDHCDQQRAVERKQHGDHRSVPDWRGVHLRDGAGFVAPFHAGSGSKWNGESHVEWIDGARRPAASVNSIGAWLSNRLSPSRFRRMARLALREVGRQLSFINPLP